MNDEIESSPTDAPSGVTRRDIIKRSAIVGGTVIWAAPVVQSLASPAFAVTAVSPPPCTNPCHVDITSCQTTSGAADMTAGGCLRIIYTFSSSAPNGTVITVTNASMGVFGFTGGSPNAGCCTSPPCSSVCGTGSVSFPNHSFTVGTDTLALSFCTTSPTLAGCPATYAAAFTFHATVCGGATSGWQAKWAFPGYHDSGAGTIACPGTDASCATLGVGSNSATVGCV